MRVTKNCRLRGFSVGAPTSEEKTFMARNLSPKQKTKARRRLAEAVLSLSPRLMLDEIANYRNAWSSVSENGVSGSSSLTDEPLFLNAVAEALSDERAAAQFRSNLAIIATYDHVSRLQGLACLLAIEGRGKAERLRELVELSDYGTPATFHYPQIGRFSPTVLRFAKVAFDLEFFFPELPQLQVTEIGVGFGGQAVAINKLFGTNSFTFYDLPEVNVLASKSLGSLTEGVKIELRDGRNPAACTSDLVVSNYAFSEMAPKIQESYLQNVLLPAKRGFMNYNSLSESALGGYKVSQIAEQLPGSILVPEEPATHPDNMTLIWGSSRVR